MKYYEITKHYRNNSDVYYIMLPDTTDVDDDILERIGDHTDGGESYGYRMESKQIDKLPKGAKLLQKTATYEIY